MKKQILCAILAVLVIFTLCSCKNEAKKDITKSEYIKDTAVSEAYNAYKEVLEGKTKFFSTDRAKEIDITEFNEWMGITFDTALAISQFTLVDLDGDSINEVVLELSVGNSESIGFEILHYMDNKVYSYSLGYRAFNMLKADGTFNYASSAASNGYGRLKFFSDICDITALAHTDLSADGSNIEFFIGEEKVTEAEYNDYVTKHDEKENPSWVELTEDNIKTYFQ